VQVIYNVRKAIPDTLQIVHNVRKAIPDTVQVIYNVRKAIPDTVQVIYNVRKAIPDTVQVIYNVRKAIPDTVQVIYNVRKAIPDTVQVIYNVRKAIPDTVQVIYNVRKAIPDTVQVIYNVRKAIPDTVQVIYNVRKAIPDTLQIIHNVRKSISDSLQIIHNVRKVISDDLSILYNVLEIGLSTVSDTLQIIFNTRSVVSDNIQLKYNVRKAIPDTLQIIHNVRKSISDSLQIIHNIGKSISDSLQIVHNVRKARGMWTEDDLALANEIRDVFFQSAPTLSVYIGQTVTVTSTDTTHITVANNIRRVLGVWLKTDTTFIGTNYYADPKKENFTGKAITLDSALPAAATQVVVSYYSDCPTCEWDATRKKSRVLQCAACDGTGMVLTDGTAIAVPAEKVRQGGASEPQEVTGETTRGSIVLRLKSEHEGILKIAKRLVFDGEDIVIQESPKGVLRIEPMICLGVKNVVKVYAEYVKY